jgi:hypothetical protein
MLKFFFFYAAAASIGIASWYILHLADLAIDPEHSEEASIGAFFIVVGLAQVFWILPTAKR